MKTMIKPAGLILFAALAAFVHAQNAGKEAGADERDPALKNWKWMFELRLPEKMDVPFVAVNLPPDVLGKANFSLHQPGQIEMPDLRLVDAKGNRVPFIERAMREDYKQTPVTIKRTFNAAPSLKARVYEASYELVNVQPPGHNEIEIFTTRKGNFRRKVEVFGDDNAEFKNPKSLLGKNKYLVYYDVEGKIVDVHRFRYDFMRYKFLQVRVHADDPSVDEEIPSITSINVRQRIDVPGEAITEPATLDSMQYTRGDGGPGTAWLVLLQDRIPCHQVTFEVAGEPSERPMRLEVAELNQPPMPISIIDKKWTKAEPRGLPDNLAPNNLELRFNEVVARRLRFVVTDFANQPLRLNNVKVTRWARKVIFEKPDEKKYTLPLRLFAGNASATPPGYEDLRKRVPENLKLAPALATIEKSVQNPAYIEPPKPLHEQMPWLVYVVLGAASLVLLIILALLVKQAITRHDAAEVAAKT